MNENDLMQAAKEIATWEDQLLKTAEECGELIAAILRWCNRAPWSRDETTMFNDIYEETIDVELMIKQIQVYMNPELLDTQRKKKLIRYEKRLKSIGQL